MKFDKKMFLFATIFQFIYFSINLYVLTRLAEMFSIEKGVLFYTLVIILSFSFIGSMIIERTTPTKFTRGIYAMAASYFGAVLLTFAAVIVYEILSIFIQLNNQISGIIIISFIFLVCTYGIINALFVRIKKINVRIGLKRPLKIAHMSDLHLGTIKNEKFLKKISTKINNLNPDIVLITGDLIDGTAPLSDNIIKKIDKIKSPIYYVIGNHEIYDGLERIIKIISKTKIKPLRDKAISFKGLQIIGLDYLEGVKLEDNLLETKLSRIKLNKNKPSILLYHSPLNINKLNDLGIDLQLAGHTHGGQIFPFHLLVRLAFRNYRGLHKFKRTTQYISEGTGTWGPTMRVLSSSEIALINLY